MPTKKLHRNLQKLMGLFWKILLCICLDPSISTVFCYFQMWHENRRQTIISTSHLPALSISVSFHWFYLSVGFNLIAREWVYVKHGSYLGNMYPSEMCGCEFNYTCLCPAQPIVYCFINAN